MSDLYWPKFFIGVDVASSGRDCTALAVVERAVITNDATPILHLHDLTSARNVPFPTAAQEVRRVVDSLDGESIVGVDAQGVGDGLLQECRRIGLQAYAIKFTGGTSVSVGPGGLNTPQTAVYEVVYRLLVQNRLKMNPDHPATPALLESMDNCEAETTPSGGTRYEVRTARGHGDDLVALGIACLLHERRLVREINARNAELLQGGERPRSGRRRLGTRPRRNPLAGRNSWREAMNLLDPLGKSSGW